MKKIIFTILGILFFSCPVFFGSGLFAQEIPILVHKNNVSKLSKILNINSYELLKQEADEGYLYLHLTEDKIIDLEQNNISYKKLKYLKKPSSIKTGNAYIVEVTYNGELYVGEPITIYLLGKNNGSSDAYENYLTLSLPDFNDVDDFGDFDDPSGGFDDLYKITAGQTMARCFGDQATASYVFVDGYEEQWNSPDLWSDGDIGIWATVTPTQTGYLDVYCKLSLDNGNSRDPSGGCQGPDQQYWPVYDYSSLYIQAHYDYWIENESVIPTTIEVGESFNVSCRQYSNGNESSDNNVYVGYYLSSNTTLNSSDDLLEDDYSTIGDDPYDPESKTCTIPLGKSAGTYYILFVADYPNDFPDETNENNNLEYVQITVTTTPDFDIISATVNPTTVYAGESVDWTCDVKNIGHADAVIADLRIYYSTSSSSYNSYNELDHSLIADTWIDGLDAGHTDHDEGTFTIPSGLSPGTYYIHFVADADNDEPNEINEDNNTEVKTIYVVSPPQITLTPTSHNFGNIPEDDVSGTVPFTLQNTGGGTATGSVSLTGSDANQFEITSGDGAFSLTAGQTKTINVRFAPTSDGNKTATLEAAGTNCDDATSTLTGNALIKTRFSGGFFVNKTAKYGIPIFFEAKLQYWGSLGWTALDGKTVEFSIKNDNGQWNVILDDSVSLTSFNTGNGNIYPWDEGRANVFYTPSSDYNTGAHEIKVNFSGDNTYGSCKLDNIYLNIHKPQWLFMVYMAADNNLEYAAVHEFYEEMSEACDNEEVSIVVLFDRSKGWHGFDNNGNWTFYDDTTHGNWTDTYYCRLCKSPSSLYSGWNYYEDWTELNMGDPATLDTFINKALDECPANNNALIFWNHGGGWVNKNLSDSLNILDICHEIEPPELIPVENEDNKENGKAVCSDYDAGDKLTMTEIRNVLNNYSKFDIIGFDACLMGMVEVAYDIKDYADFMIASEDIVTQDEWEYQNILTNSYINSGTNSLQLGEAIVNSGGYPLSGTNPGQMGYYYTLGCWDLSQIDLLNNEISSFAERLLELLPNPGIKDIIENTIYDFDPGDCYEGQFYRQEYLREIYANYIDLREFALDIASNITDATLQSKANAVASRLVNNSFRTSWNTNYSSVYGGLTIYFPEHLNTSDILNMNRWEDYFTDGIITFTSNTSQLWDDFILAYHDNESPICNITHPSSQDWKKGNVFIITNSDDTTSFATSGVKYVEFQYSLNNYNWYPLPGTDSDGIDDDGQPWELTFNTIGTPEYGTLNKNNVSVRARAMDLAGNYSDWSDVSFGVDNTNPVFLNYAHSNPSYSGSYYFKQNILDNLSGVLENSNYPKFYYRYNNSTINENNYDGVEDGDLSGNYYKATINIPENHVGDNIYWRILAKDNASNEVWSNTYNGGLILDDDESPPIFANFFDSDNEVPGPYNFSVDITDNSGILVNSSSPLIYYRFNNSTIDADNYDGYVNAGNSGSNTYEATINIGYSHVGEVIYWRVFASDNDNSPETAWSNVQTGGLIEDNPPVVYVEDSTTICNGASITLNCTASAGEPPYTFIWSPATGLDNPNIQNPTASSVTTTTYLVTLTDNYGNTATDQVTVYVSNIIANAGNDVSICYYGSTTLNATGGASSSWSPVTGLSNPNISNPIATPDSTITYTVTVTDSYGCSDIDDVTITVGSQLVVDAGNDISICEGQGVYLSAGGGITYNWSPSTGLSDTTISNPYANPLQTTIYTVSVSDGSGCSGTDSITVIVNSLPVASVFGDTTICEGETTTITASGGSYYSWSPENSLDNSNISNPQASPSQTTTYNVIVSDINGCEDTGSVTVNVINVNADAGSDIYMCKGDTVNLNANGGITYNWNPSIGLSNDSIFNPYAFPSQTTTYAVIVTDSNGCSNTDEIILVVSPLPDIFVSNDVTICEGDTTILAVSGTSTYNWSPTVGILNPNSNTTMAFPDTTTNYFVTGTDDNGCQNTDSLTVYVNSIPDVYIGEDTILCGGSIMLDAGNPCASYIWSPTGDTSQTINVVSTEQYTVTVTNENDCESSSSIFVDVRTTPQVFLNGNNPFCLGDSVSLSTNYNSDIQWYLNSNPIQDANSQFYYPLESGIYQVNETNCNFMSDMYSITANVPPDTPSISIIGNFCEGDSIILTSSSPVNNIWSTGESTQSIIVTTSGNYYVSVSDSNYCSSVSEIVDITINPLPIVNLGFDTTVCGSIILDAGNNFSNYLWNDGSESQSITITTTGEYQVTVTDENTCTNSDTINITVHDLPYINFDDIIICFGNDTTLNAGDGFIDYLWSTGLNDSIITINEQGIYSITVTDINNCSNSDTFEVITDLPFVDLGKDTTIYNNEMIILDAGAGFKEYLWNNGLTSRSISVVGSFLDTISYTYSVIVTNYNNCINSDTIVITIKSFVDVFSINTVPSIIKIYPNPATNTINIVFEDKSYKDVKVSLLNIQGQVISGIKQTTVNSNTLQLNLSNCSNGIYYLNIQTDKGTFVRKISVIK